jgi:hypothetical protein
VKDPGDAERGAARRTLSSLHDQPDLVSGVHAQAAGESLPEDDPVRSIAEVAALSVVQLGEEAGLGGAGDPLALTSGRVLADDEDGADRETREEVRTPGRRLSRAPTAAGCSIQ